MAVGVSIRGLAQTLKKTLGGTSVPAADWWGTVQTVNTGPPPSVTCTVNGTASSVTCQYGNAYAYSGPAIGDVVFGRTDGQGDYWVTDSLCTVATSPQGLVPIGMCVPSPFTVSDPAWLLLAGGTFLAATYPQLYTLNGSSTTLPDWRGVSPMGAGLNGIILGTKNLVGAMISHAHTGAPHLHTHTHPDPGHGHQTAWGSSTAFDAPAGGTWVELGNAPHATTTNPANLGSDSTAASAANTGLYPATGTANIPPNIGANWYVRAL